ncbi:ABC transporter permease [Bordetella genomosp. 10]|uniref:ABC transporter permease n=1 Tax=Bordetella genomosp. 10 TaxID=1416804 RepID=A0A261S2J5_9BORD|nr:amino acid ABC transporter permease [Bordetella genomosp. 10]OZI31584.1 ABC transporter permease [Bordetella genomosp. 10]
MTISFNLAAVLTPGNLEILAHGIEVTLAVSAASWTAGMMLSMVLLAARLSKNRLLLFLAHAFISYHRNVPVLVQLMFWYFGISTLLPTGLRQSLQEIGSEFIFSAIALSLYISAYFCEDLRSGLRAILPGQHEAARALGFNFVRSMAYIIMPQCVRNAFPALMNNTIVLFKASSLGMAVGLAELTYVAREIENATFRTFEIYAVATAIYVVFCLLLMLAGDLVSRRYRKEQAR